MKCDKCGYDWGDSGDSAHACAFYQTLKPSTHSPQRTWVGLTEREQGEIMEDLNAHGTNIYKFARAIEAKLKAKNSL